MGQNASECSFDPAYLAKRLITLPYDLTLGIQDASRDGDTGPLFLVLFPLFLAYVSIRSRTEVQKALWSLLFFTATSYAFWVAGVIMSAPLWQSRLLLPALKREALLLRMGRVDPVVDFYICLKNPDHPWRGHNLLGFPL